MSRLAATIHGDGRLQLRQGFYYAAAFMLAVLIAVGRELPPEILAWLLPVMSFTSLCSSAPATALVSLRR